MDVSEAKRVVLLGKSGVGKSSLANTILGEAKFQINHFDELKARPAQAETTLVNGRSITVIDTPGFFDAGRSEKKVKTDILRCYIECAPGPHAFLIVLRAEKFTEQEQAVINKIEEQFSEEALKHAAVVFTQGDQLPEGMKIEEFIDQNKNLSDLVKKCGGRCHIVDNKYWKNNQQDEYRSNQFQVAELLKTIDKIVIENSEGYYTNETLQQVEKAIQGEEEHIRRSGSGNMTQEEIRKQAKSRVAKKQVDSAAGTWVTTFVGFAIIAGLLAAVSAVLINLKFGKVLREAPNDQDFTAITVAAADPALNPDSALEKVFEKMIKPAKVIQKTFVAIMEKLNALYERTFNPWNPFE